SQITAAVVGAASTSLTVLATGTTGNVALTGTAANTFAGTTIVRGTLDLQDSAGNAIVGPLVITGIVRDQANNQLTTAPVTVNGTRLAGQGVLDLNNFSDTVASLTMLSGNVTTGTGTLTLGGNVTSIAVAAPTSPATITGNLSLGPVTRTFTVGLGT